jgi:hypothetical protein
MTTGIVSLGLLELGAVPFGSTTTVPTEPNAEYKVASTDEE